MSKVPPQSRVELGAMASRFRQSGESGRLNYNPAMNPVVLFMLGGFAALIASCRVGCRSQLRWVLTALWICAAQAILPQARADSHLWTDQDGHHYDADITGFYNGTIVTLRRTDGRTVSLALTDLVAQDQLVARQWLLKQPDGTEKIQPPDQTLSLWGRSFILDDPRVVRLQILDGKGYNDAYLAVPVTVRNDKAGPLSFVNFYFFDTKHKRIHAQLIPPDKPVMIQDGGTTAFVTPASMKPGQTYLVLYPLVDPELRMAPLVVIVAGNDRQMMATVYPEGSWRDFDFPERDSVAKDKYADYSGQELYSAKATQDLFEIADVTRLVPRSVDHSPEHDYFRLSLRMLEPFPATALSGQWYAFDKEHHLLHAEDVAPYADPTRKDVFFYVLLAGRGRADITDPVLATVGDALHTMHLPGAAWWDKPEVDSIVFVFGTETKKIARVFSKSGTRLADLPVPEKEALGSAKPATEVAIPRRDY